MKNELIRLGQSPKGDGLSDESLITIEQLAHRLNVSTSTVYRLVASGRIGHLRVGCGRGTIRFSRGQIEAYLARAESMVRGPQASSTRPTRPLKHLRIGST